jgi:hypothetical protein
MNQPSAASVSTRREKSLKLKRAGLCHGRSTAAFDCALDVGGENEPSRTRGEQREAARVGSVEKAGSGRAIAGPARCGLLRRDAIGAWRQNTCQVARVNDFQRHDGPPADIDDLGIAVRFGRLPGRLAGAKR